ncbi:MAG: acylphosphatase [Thermoplasmata archaeon]|nr:acylphosphatase [Thermoplasmata archaeon]
MSKKTDSVDDEQDTLTRAEILVIGYVQEAGYRAMVLDRALKRKLKGTVENLPDGTVKIIAEGPKEIIREFIREINIRNQTIRVEDIKTKFCKPTGEFNWFGVTYANLGHELFQGFATAKKYFDKIGDKVDKIGDKVDTGFETLGKKMDTGFETLGKKMDKVGDKVDRVGDLFIQGNKELKDEMSQFHQESKESFQGLGDKIDSGFESMGTKFDHGFNGTSQHFQSLDGKYHTVTDELKRIRKAVEGGLTIKERKVEYSAEKENDSGKGD